MSSAGIRRDRVDVAQEDPAIRQILLKIEDKLPVIILELTYIRNVHIHIVEAQLYPYNRSLQIDRTLKKFKRVVCPAASPEDQILGVYVLAVIHAFDHRIPDRVGIVLHQCAPQLVRIPDLHRSVEVTFISVRRVVGRLFRGELGLIRFRIHLSPHCLFLRRPLRILDVRDRLCLDGKILHHLICERIVSGRDICERQMGDSLKFRDIDQDNGNDHNCAEHAGKYLFIKMYRLTELPDQSLSGRHFERLPYCCRHSGTLFRRLP